MNSLSLKNKIKLNLKTVGCPFCDSEENDKDASKSIRNIVHRLKYSDVHLHYSEIEDFEGCIEHCEMCGIYFVNPRYDEKEFSKIYRNLSRKSGNISKIKKIAQLPTKLILTKWHAQNPVQRYLTHFLGSAIDTVLQLPIPPVALSTKSRILDVGCGDGFHLRCFGELSKELYATEIHPGYEPILSTGPERIRFWIEEFTSIDWESETGYEKFDLIIFQSVFYRLNNPRESLELAWRLLKPGGYILRIEPFCSDVESAKFLNSFNFPQGFTFIQNLETYISRLRRLYPDAEFKWKIFYGRSHKTCTGREFNFLSAGRDFVMRLFKTLFKKEAYFIKLLMHKPVTRE